MTESTTSGDREPVAADVKAIIADAEELLQATASATGERIATARARIQERLRSAREKLEGLDDLALAQAKDVAKSADTYVHEHPWGAVGIAAVAGLIVGVLLARR